MVVGNDEDMEIIISKLKNKFEVCDLGNLNNFSNVNIYFDRQNNIMKLYQSAQIKNILKCFGIENFNVMYTIVEKNLNLIS